MEQPVVIEARPARRKGQTILLAGNDRRALGDLAEGLGSLGHLVVLGEIGSQALELIAARGFDLVVLDCSDDLDVGMHVLGEVRSARDTADLPIVMVVPGAPASLMADALNAGADDCVTHPYAFAELAARVERTLARAARVQELKRSNLALDARIAARAMELGEAKTELAAAREDRLRLIAALRDLHEELARAPSA